MGQFELDAAETKVFHEACRAIDELDELRAAIRRDGVTASGSKGQPVAHPALAVASSHRALLARLLSQLALPFDDGSLVTPSNARAKKAAGSRWKGHVTHADSLKGVR
jgi:P27 family predicted phage terminase small subunit